LFYTYPIVIHKDASSDFGVSVPDLPGCFSAGKTLDEALRMAQEAIESHLELLNEEDASLPVPSTIDSWRENPDFAGGTWAFVRIDTASLRLKVKRVALTLPERAAEALDHWALTNHATRSAAVTKAIWAMLRSDLDSCPSVSRGGATLRRLTKAAGVKSKASKKEGGRTTRTRAQRVSKRSKGAGASAK
jgi:predicted RNase H-like HicB family nuclease